MITERALEEILMAEGYLTREQLSEAVTQKSRASESVADVLVRQGMITESQKLKCVAIQTGIPYMDLRDQEIPIETAKLLSQRSSLRNRAIVIEATDSAATIAMANPLDLELLDDMQRELDRDVDPMWATESDIFDKLSEIFGGFSDVNEIIMEASRDIESTGLEVAKGESEEEQVSIVELREGAEGGPVVQLANALFAQAIKFRASDIHIEPRKNSVRVRFRIDGVLKDMMEFPKEVHRAVVSRIKIVSSMDIAERRSPQDGRCSLVTNEGEFDFRVATYPSVHGEKVCIRVLDKRKSNQDIVKLGIPTGPLSLLLQCAEASQGLILVNGPTGSGKTTTLYSLLNHLNNSERHIITIEDPVEYQMDGIIQGNVNNAAGVSFASGLRAMLRQDPDVILVGESRDPETAKTAIEASLTGHLVLTSLHANDSASAVARLVEMGIEPFLVGASVTASVAQRLVRASCVHCCKPYSPDPSILERIGLSLDHEYVKGMGCDKCAQTGYKGRMGVYEVMIVNNDVRQLITENRPGVEIMAKAVASNGMEPMLVDARAKVISGHTTPEEVIRVIAVEAN